MDGVNVDEIDYRNHKFKCRICFKSFNAREQQVEITRTLELKFLDVTQTNLKISNELSNKLCGICSLQLQNHWDYRRNVVEAQSRLYKFTSKHQSNTTKVKIERNEDFEASINEDSFPFATCLLNVKQELHTDSADNNDNWQSDSDFEPQASSAKVQQKSSTSKCRRLKRSHGLTCNDCEFTCDSKTDLKTHERTHLTKIKIQSHKCLICAKVFNNLNQLHKHEFKVHEEVICIHCNKSIKGSASLKTHMDQFHKSNLPCPHTGCGKIFADQAKLKDHMRSHDTSLQVICPQCGKLLSNNKSLNRHINRVHLKLLHFTCDLCDYRGCSKNHIRRHVNIHMDKSQREVFICYEPGCAYQCYTPHSLNEHRRYKHLGTGKIYTCHCGRVFSHSSSYSHHVKSTHGNVKNFECQHCTKSFLELWKLKNHIKIQHDKQKDIPCTNLLCNKMFSTNRQLKIHMKFHEPPRHICDYPDCKKEFYAADKLLAHHKFHNNQKDHKCHLCDKCYFHKTNLNKHFRQSHPKI